MKRTFRHPVRRVFGGRDEENVLPPGAEGLWGAAESSAAGGGAARPLAQRACCA